MRIHFHSNGLKALAACFSFFFSSLLFALPPSPINTELLNQLTAREDVLVNEMATIRENLNAAYNAKKLEVPEYQPILNKLNELEYIQNRCSSLTPPQTSLCLISDYVSLAKKTVESILNLNNLYAHPLFGERVYQACHAFTTSDFPNYTNFLIHNDEKLSAFFAYFSEKEKIVRKLNERMEDAFKSIQTTPADKIVTLLKPLLHQLPDFIGQLLVHTIDTNPTRSDWTALKGLVGKHFSLYLDALNEVAMLAIENKPDLSFLIIEKWAKQGIPPELLLRHVQNTQALWNSFDTTNIQIKATEYWLKWQQVLKTGGQGLFFEDNWKLTQKNLGEKRALDEERDNFLKRSSLGFQEAKRLWDKRISQLEHIKEAVTKAIGEVPFTWEEVPAELAPFLDPAEVELRYASKLLANSEPEKQQASFAIISGIIDFIKREVKDETLRKKIMARLAERTILKWAEVTWQLGYLNYPSQDGTLAALVSNNHHKISLLYSKVNKLFPGVIADNKVQEMLDRARDEGRRARKEALNTGRSLQEQEQDMWFIKLLKVIPKVAESVSDITVANLLYWTGFPNLAVDWIVANREVMNKVFGGSILGSEHELMNATQFELFARVFPVAQLGQGFNPLIEGVHETYEWYAKTVTGLSDKQYRERLQHDPLLKAGEASFYIAQASMGLALSMPTSNLAWLAQLKSATRVLSVAGGLSGATALGQELILSGDQNGTFDIKRLLSTAGESTSGSLLFMGGLAKAAKVIAGQGEAITLASISRAQTFTRGVDVVEGLGGLQDTATAFKVADTWQKWIGASIIAGANFVDTFDVSLSGIVKNLSHLRSQFINSQILREWGQNDGPSSRQDFNILPPGVTEADIQQFQALSPEDLLKTLSPEKRAKIEGQLEVSLTRAKERYGEHSGVTYFADISSNQSSSEHKMELGIAKKIAYGFINSRFPLSEKGEELSARVRNASNDELLKLASEELPTVEEPRLDLFRDLNIPSYVSLDDFTNIQLTKGCSHQCGFCAVSAGPKIQFMPFPAVLKFAEIFQKNLWLKFDQAWDKWVNDIQSEFGVDIQNDHEREDFLKFLENHTQATDSLIVLYKMQLPLHRLVRDYIFSSFESHTLQNIFCKEALKKRLVGPVNHHLRGHLYNYYDSDPFDYRDSNFLHKNGTPAHFGDAVRALTSSQNKMIFVTTAGWPKGFKLAQLAAEDIVAQSSKRWEILNLRYSVNKSERLARRNLEKYRDNVIANLQVLHIANPQVIIYEDDTKDFDAFRELVAKPVEEFARGLELGVIKPPISGFSGREAGPGKKANNDVMACLHGWHVWPDGTLAWQQVDYDAISRQPKETSKGSRPKPIGWKAWDLDSK